MPPETRSENLTPAEFETIVQDIRPELHRYTARMIGSAIDAEDVVQEALIKAYNSLDLLTSRSNVRGWLFRITHNKAIDQLRGYSRQPLELLDEYPMTAEPDQPLEEKELAALAMSVFLKLPPRQRSCVIFKDVLGYSLAEISELLNATVPEIKATLHRGRTRLRELSKGIEVVSAPLIDEKEQALLTRYVDYFNARDFDAIQTMLAAEVQLDLVRTAKVVGAAEVSRKYFTRLKSLIDCHLVVGMIEGQLVALAYDSTEPSSLPAYFIQLTWNDSQVSHIRDYRFARDVMLSVQITR